MDIIKESLKLLDLIAVILNANKGFRPATEREWYAEGLANKFVNHAFTVIRLASTQNILELPSQKIEISALASIDVLTRAAFEAFLVFHYVFFMPKTEEERDCKYLAYRLGGILERQNLPASSEEFKLKLIEDRKAINEVIKHLEANKEFQSLGEKQKKGILKGNWRSLSWSEIAKDVNLDSLIASHGYRHLCGYAHSSSLSVLQIKQAFEKGEERSLYDASVITVNVTMANMIYEYCELFPKAKEALSSQKGIDLVHQWIIIGRGK